MKKSKVIFIICILCWVIYFLLGIRAAFSGSYPISFGWSMSTENRTLIYGIDAFKEALLGYLLVFSVIPVLPISLVYIIIYLIVNIVKNNVNKVK